MVYLYGENWYMDMSIAQVENPEADGGGVGEPGGALVPVGVVP